MVKLECFVKREIVIWLLGYRSEAKIPRAISDSGLGY
jgi:hypothetical protein